MIKKRLVMILALFVVAVGLALISPAGALQYVATLGVVTPPGYPALNPKALVWSPTGEFTEEIVSCGLGYPADFPPSVAGKIALIQRGELTFRAKTLNAAAVGAVAVIIYNNVPSAPQTWTLDGVTPIPAVGISQTEGGLLLSLLMLGPVTVHLKVGPYEVDIDIKPGSCPNSINLKSKGVVPVAVLTTVDFSASDVDPSSVVFAGASPVRWTIEDVDGDGDMDMLFHFRTQDLNLNPASTEATLTGFTTWGYWAITGTDSVKIVPK